MLKWVKKRPWLTVTLVAAFIFASLFLISLCVQVTPDLCSYNEHTQKEECAQHHLGPFVVLWIVMVADAHNGFVTAIATVFLTGITYMLVKLGREQSATTRAELRAYVTGKARGLMLDADGETLSVFVEIINSGQTPAFNVRVPAGIAIAAPPPHRFNIGTREISDGEISSIPLFTLSKDGSSICEPKKKFTYPDRIALAASKDRVYVFGLIAYTDIFGDEMWAEFCAYLEGKGFLEAFAVAEKSKRTKIEISFKVPGFGNDASFRPGRSSKH